MPAHQFLQPLQQYVLTPIGLLALLGLIPLVLIYLMKPEPEERIMPSMVFFMEERRSGMMEKALRTLQRNLVLLLNILFIVGIAAALANPFIIGEQTADQSVIVVDVSASMADDMDAVKQFVEREAGAQTTLVVAGEHVSVPLEQASAGSVARYVNGLEARDVETDIRSGLEVAASYDGAVAVASDLDQTVGSGDAAEVVDRLETRGRRVTVMDTAAGNRWGIVGIDARRGNSSVDVKNVMERDATVTLRAGAASTTLDIPAGAVETVTVPTPPGKTTLQLEDDPVPADNTGYVAVPEDRHVSVLLLSDSGNPHLETALELINFTSVETAAPPLQQVPEADVYIVGETENLLRSTAGELGERARNGASLVVFAQDSAFKTMPFLPVERQGGRRTVTVEIQEPRRVLVGETEVFNVAVEQGAAMATHNALVRARHGKGQLVFYNLRDQDFRFDFLYPVFWKDLLGQLTDRPTVGDRNRGTGEELNVSTVETPGGQTENGPVQLTTAGFYETAQGTYAANLLSADESGEEAGSGDDAITGGASAKKPLQPLAAALLLALALGEFAYLRYRGTV